MDKSIFNYTIRYIMRSNISLIKNGSTSESSNILYLFHLMVLGGLGCDMFSCPHELRKELSAMFGHVANGRQYHNHWKDRIILWCGQVLQCIQSYSSYNGCKYYSLCKDSDVFSLVVGAYTLHSSPNKRSFKGPRGVGIGLDSLSQA